jgi:CubicO group peptidase (beta-lactamase class C family)
MLNSARSHPDLMRNFVLLLLGLLSVTALTAREIQQVTPVKAGLSDAKLREVDQFMSHAVADQKIAGGIVMISHQGDIAFFRTYGLMDREANKPVKPDTIFRIYSMSKAITTAAALTLYDAGKIRLDDPVSKYIPSFANLKVATADGLRTPTRPMTIKDLMRHTSGLTYGGGPDALKEAYAQLKPLRSVNLAEMVEKLSRAPLAFDPGTRWDYSISTDVLGRVIEVVSGENLDVFLERTIFKPLEMTDTGFRVPPQKIGRFAANYSRSPDGLRLIDAPAKSKYTRRTRFFSGGAGLVSTARDYMRFAAMIERGGTLDGHHILQPNTVALMTSNQLPPAAFPIAFGGDKRPGLGFGLGFAVRTEFSGVDPTSRVGEYGWSGAASTHFWANPNDKLIVITLEQIMPYQGDTMAGVKPIIYDAVKK